MHKCAFQDMTSLCVIFARHFAYFRNTKCRKLRGVCGGGSIVRYTYLELELVGGQIGILQHCFRPESLQNVYGLCGLVDRVSGYRYRGLGFDSRRYQIF